MATSHPVLRFPISERDEEYFLLQVVPIQGSKNPLDLRLCGTESIGAYEAKLRHRRVQDLKDGQCTDEEWEQILIATFIDPTNSHREHVEVTTEVQEDSAKLIFKRNISGVKHRLGSVILDEFPIVTAKDGSDNGPQLFDWCVAAIGDRAKVVDDLAAATARAVELESQANELKSHLADLLKAKEDDEKHLLEKFQDLLNEKKLKIRQQQRLLASAEVDPARLENAGASQNTVRKAKASRGSKRKVVQEPEDESDDGFEKMDVDASAPNPIEEDPEMDVRQTTDEELEDATASDTQDSDEEPPQPTVKGKGKGKTKASAKTKVPVKSPASRKTKGSTSSRTTRATKGKTATAPSEVDGQDVDAQPPPRRTLPFKSKAKEKTPEPVKTADDETETDDDEL